MKKKGRGQREKPTSYNSGNRKATCDCAHTGYASSGAELCCWWCWAFTAGLCPRSCPRPENGHGEAAAGWLLGWEKEQNHGFGELQQGGLTPCPCAGCMGRGVAKAPGAERGRWVTSFQVLPGLKGPALQRN